MKMLDVIVYNIVLVLSIISIIGVTFLDVRKSKKEQASISVDELPKLKKTTSIDKFVKKHCTKCSSFDGYDMCLHRKHEGTVTQNTVEHCKLNKDYEE